MKSCSQCKQTKSFDLFYKNRSTKDGYSNVCKECQLNNERTNNLKSKEWLISLKTKCEKCDEKRHWVLDFHHKDPSKKTMTISTYAISGTANFNTKKIKIEEELKHCCILCSNCHRDFHYLEKKDNITIEKYLNF